MPLHLIQRRAIWWPTWPVWTCLFALSALPFLLWCFQGEAFLASSRPLPAEVLVVEGWIGNKGLQAAESEFARGGYRYIVATGGLTGARWYRRRWSYATEAEEFLLNGGMPREKVIVAIPRETEEHRTYESALAVRLALHDRGIRPQAINVFTMGAHARRSRLVFAKVLQPEAEVGVVAWSPPGYFAGPWWRSSDRANNLLKETIGWLFEVLLNSGRTSNSPETPKS